MIMKFKQSWIARIAVLLAFAAVALSACQLLVPADEPIAPERTVAPGVPLADATATELMYQLSEDDEGEIEAALRQVRASRDERFVPVLIELLRAAQIGLVPRVDASIDTLEALSGQNFGDRWDLWVEWYGGTDLVPPPGFTSWKGRMLSFIDPGFGEFLRDELPSDIRTEEIQWGGVRVDGIPALDHARMLAPEEADYIVDSEPIFGIEINGDARAYPLRILDWHEMANDTVGGVPVSLAYCTLCGAAIAYDGRASDGVTYDFGSSGFLFRSNKLMYDRQTRTLWNQLTGKPVLGKLVESDLKLDLLPVVLTSWEEWLEQHPDTVVLDRDTGFSRPYELASAYGHYFSAPDTMFPVWQRGERLDTKDQIYALNIDDIPVAYPIDVVAAEEVINHTIGETDVVVIGQRGVVEVTGESRGAGPVQYSAGSEIRAYDRGSLRFAPGLNPDTVLDEDGNEWQVTEAMLVGPDGLTAPRINGHLAYWFGWYSFFPQTEVYEVDES